MSNNSSFATTSTEILGTLAPSIGELGTLLPNGDRATCMTIKDTFAISAFKSIPLIWKLEQNCSEYFIDVKSEGIIVKADFTCDRVKTMGDLHKVKGYIKRLYKRELKVKKLLPIVKEIAAKASKALGIEPESYPWIKIYFDKYSDSQWGYCESGRNTISIDYKVADAPREYLNDLVVHECCHLKIPDHDKDFWDLYYKTVKATGLEIVYDWEMFHGHEFYDYPFRDGRTSICYNKESNNEHKLMFERNNYYMAMGYGMRNK